MGSVNKQIDDTNENEITVICETFKFQFRDTQWQREVLSLYLIGSISQSKQSQAFGHVMIILTYLALWPSISLELFVLWPTNANGVHLTFLFASQAKAKLMVRATNFHFYINFQFSIILHELFIIYQRWVKKENLIKNKKQKPQLAESDTCSWPTTGKQANKIQISKYDN